MGSVLAIDFKLKTKFRKVGERDLTASVLCNPAPKQLGGQGLGLGRIFVLQACCLCLGCADVKPISLFEGLCGPSG